MSVIGVDLGGTNIRAGRVRNGKILKTAELRTCGELGRAYVIERLLTAIDTVMARDVTAIGIGSPGPLDVKRGMILKTPNLPLHNTNIIRLVKTRFNKKVCIENDANCFVLGEAVYGKASNCSTVLGLTLGTGIGGGIVIDKKIFAGRGNAGEFGHMTLNQKGPRCGCGRKGCVEAFLNIDGLLSRAERKGIKTKSTKDLFELAEKRNRKAVAVFNEYGRILGLVISNLTCAFDPDAVVIGGGIAGAWRFFVKEMKNYLAENSFLKPPKVYRGSKKSALLGAAALVSR